MTAVFPAEIAQALSAALLHFIWQGTLVAFLLWITLAMLRNRTAKERYAASCAALALMAALPVITVWMLNRQAAAIAVSSAILKGTAVEIYAVRIARQSAPLAWIATWRQWTLPVWALGVLVFALRLAPGYRHVAALRRLGHAAEGQIVDTVALLARRMQATRAIRVLISTLAESPSVVGWLRPVILLPAAALAGLEPEQLQAVLAHEIAHIRRHDYLVNLAQTMVETLLFYHPAVWWTSQRIRHERELCCDDAAVAVCGNAISYARALTSLERLRAVTPRLALGSTGGSLMYRIQRLAGVKPEIAPSKLPGIAALALAVACFAMTVHWAKAQQMKPAPALSEEWGITVSTTGEVLRRERVPYPEATYLNGIQGTVTLEATLDQSGRVMDAHVISGPPELRKTALQSLLQWQFASAYAGETQQVGIKFQQDTRAQLQHDLRKTVSQASLTESFLKDELKAAREKGDSRAIQEAREKLKVAEEAAAISGTKEQLAQVEQFGQEQDKLRANLAELESKPHTQAVDTQLAQVKMTVADLQESVAQAQQAEQNRAIENIDAQLKRMKRQLAEARLTLGDGNPQIIALRSQIEFLQNASGGVSLVGARIARIELSGLSDSEKAELAAKLPIRVGYILSFESMRSAMATIRELDPSLKWQFYRENNGDATLLLTH